MTISAILTKADRICDYIPFVSTLSNLTTLFLKCIPSAWLPREVAQSRYWQHIHSKDLVWSLALLVPIANIGLMIGRHCIDRVYSKEMLKLTAANLQQKREIEALIQESRRLEQALRRELGVNSELEEIDQILSERKEQIKELLGTLKEMQKEANDEIKRLETI